jgi:hypothetical protein
MDQSLRTRDGLGGGRILIDGRDKGGGTAIYPQVAITAGHVIAGTPPDVPVVFKTKAEQLVPATNGIHFVEGRDAAVIGLANKVAWSPIDRAVEGQRWSVGATGLKNDPWLTGVVTKTGLEIEDSAKNRLAVMQLHVEQELGGFAGYSGSAVRNANGNVVGILIEQLLQRLAMPRPPASNVLYALPVFDVIKRLTQPIPVPSIEELARKGVDGKDELLEKPMLRDVFGTQIEHYARTYAQAWARRGDFMDRLNHFIGDSGHGYLVVTAPPGSGKTALIATALNQRPSRVIYHLFSGVWYDRGGLEETFFLQNVVEQLMRLQGDGGEPPESVMKLRAIYHSMMSRPSNSPVTVVLDGLDEVTGWHLMPYLSRHLPDNVRFIVTMQDERDCAGKYGIPPEQTTFLRLDEVEDEIEVEDEAEAVVDVQAPAQTPADEDQPTAVEYQPTAVDNAPAPDKGRPVPKKNRPHRGRGGVSQASLRAGLQLNALTDQLQAQVMQTEGAAAREWAQYQELQLEADASNAAAEAVAKAAQFKMQTNARIMQGFNQVLEGLTD